jgi:hypothetical protein
VHRAKQCMPLCHQGGPLTRRRTRSRFSFELAVLTDAGDPLAALGRYREDISEMKMVKDVRPARRMCVVRAWFAGCLAAWN